MIDNNNSISEYWLSWRKNSKEIVKNKWNKWSWNSKGYFLVGKEIRKCFQFYPKHSQTTKFEGKSNWWPNNYGIRRETKAGTQNSIRILPINGTFHFEIS